MEQIASDFEFQAWLPSRRSGMHVAIVGLVAALLWFGLFISPETSRTAIGVGVYAAGALLLGGAFGCFYGTLVLILNALLVRLRLTTKQFEPPHRAVRMAAFFYCAHIGFVGALALCSLWKPPWSWAFGLLPFLWH